MQWGKNGHPRQTETLRKTKKDTAIGARKNFKAIKYEKINRKMSYTEKCISKQSSQSHNHLIALKINQRKRAKKSLRKPLSKNLHQGPPGWFSCLSN